MKRLSALILAALLCLAANAQFRWGPTAGLTVTDLHFKQHLFDVDQRVGASAGVLAELMFPGIGLGIDFGLNYELRGANLHLGQRKLWASQGYTTERSYLHYLQLPVHLRFKWTRMNGLEDIIAPIAYAGPSFNFLLGHNRIPALEYSGGDVALEVGLGVELYRRWQLLAGYSWGMTYALKTRALMDMSAQNRTWDVRLVYFF